MRSQIVWGSVFHWRKSPREHSFTYPVFTGMFDVDELLSLGVAPGLFAYNKRAMLSLRASDYLDGEGTLREKVERVLVQHGRSERPARITLFTSPRYFGYVFNPVSFFACFDAQDRVVGLITQVNNTFGDTHIYPLVCDPTPMPVTWHFTKGFFVSPFFDMEGMYEVALESEGATPHIRVDLHRGSEKVFAASLKGTGRPFNRAQLINTLIKFPVTLLLTMPRIHLQAMKLYFKARVQVYIRPRPSSAYTIRSRQNIIHRARLALLAVLRKARHEG